MISQIHVYPPLGVLTSVRQKTICFRVYFVICDDAMQRAKEEICEVEVWTDMRGDVSWEGVALEKLQEETAHSADNEMVLLDQAQLPHGHHIKSFGLSIPSTTPKASHFEFTVRWRKDSQSDWQWVSDLGQNARVVVYRNVPDLNHRPALNHWRQQLRHLLLKDDSTAQPLTPIADSWRASNTSASCVFKPQGKQQTRGEIAFGRLASIERYLAFVRKDKFWIIPQNGSGSLDLNGFEIVILICELCNGAVAAMMPLVKDDTRAITVTFLAAPENKLSLLAAPPSLCTSNIGIRVAASVSGDIQSAVEELFCRIHQSVATYGSSDIPLIQRNECSYKSLVSLSSSLGYCTWNTFYQNISKDAIVSTLKDIKQAADLSKQPMPKWIMIDDGWQSVDRYNGLGKLYDIYANEEKFPGQLKCMVLELANIGIQRVGVWHALWGYWGGIDPDGPLAARYNVEKHHRKASSAVKEDSDVWLISSKDINQFYDEFYEWLYLQGISFVKVDYQSAFETLGAYTAASDCHDGGYAISELYFAYYNAMEKPERGSLDPRERMLFRNSDDYFPDVPESHGWHIYCNMANSIWSRMLYGYFVTDWDMFKPGRRESRMHSISRIMSGGPVYITGDKDDFTAQNLSEVAGRGSQILECNAPLIDSNSAFADSTQSPRLLLSSCASHMNPSVLIYMCNVSAGTVVSSVDISQLYRSVRRNSSQILDVQSPRVSTTHSLYAIHQYSTRKILVAEDLGSIYAIALQPLTCDILTVAPMSVFRSTDRSALLHVACIGDITRYGGVNVVERDVSSVLPDSPRGPSPCMNDRTELAERYSWNIRAKVSLPSSKVAFVFYVRKGANCSKDLSLSVTNIRASGVNLNIDDWTFDSFANVLSVAIPFQTNSQNDEPSTRITVTLSCSFV
ncbi:hypothetical protein IW138_005562 [Coemansia sp. RSA 986]|nr:hypothetical protein IW138_005562 [Coemansia sp. RSA 986]